MHGTHARHPRPGARTEFVIGIDEVGRGPLAGPVTVAASLVPKRIPFRRPLLASKLRDSKRLSSRARENWNEFIRTTPHISVAVASISARAIDKRGISESANAAASRALRALYRQEPHKVRKSAVFLDAGLRIDQNTLILCGIRRPPVELIRGDERIQAIALASIVAKVNRDGLMSRLSRSYPAYRFDSNKGYGTKVHMAAIRAYGPAAVHRLTFLRNLRIMER
jgi:ribonuclease HII